LPRRRPRVGCGAFSASNVTFVIKARGMELLFGTPLLLSIRGMAGNWRTADNDLTSQKLGADSRR
jgi:hypothetical protein